MLFPLILHTISGILANSTPDFRCSQHCFFIDTSGMCGQLTGEEITLGAVSQPPKALLHVFYHHQLSSPTAWHLCPHPQQASSLGRAAWLYHDLTGLLWVRAMRTEPVCRTAGSWAANEQGAGTITSQGPVDSNYCSRSRWVLSLPERMQFIPESASIIQQAGNKQTFVTWALLVFCFCFPQKGIR